MPKETMPNLLKKISIIIGVSLLAATFMINEPERPYAAQTVTPAKVQATIKNVEASQNLFTIKMEKRTTSFIVTPQTKISTADGKPLVLGDMKKGDEVKVAWIKDGEKLVASEVTVILPAEFKDKGKGKGKGKNKRQGDIQ